MISERQFATSFSSFWMELCPFMTRYVSMVNKSLARYGAPVELISDDRRRGQVNETAFNLSQLSYEKTGNKYIESVETTVLSEAKLRAQIFIQNLENDVVNPLNDFEERESIEIAKSLTKFVFNRGSKEKVLYRPRFRGCGFVAPCEGDVLIGDCLIEVKAGERNFRGTDFKQLLVYSTLLFLETKSYPKELGLVNPRYGLFHVVDIEQLCTDTCSLPTEEVFARVSNFMQGLLISK